MSELRLRIFGDSPHDDVLGYIAEHHGELPSPLYLYSTKALIEAVASYRSLFPAGARGFYSLKANPQPGLLRRFCDLGLGAEVVSPGEWRVAREVGAADIVVGGVSRSAAFFDQVLGGTPTVVILDSASEWQRLSTLASIERPVDVLLRINPGVSFGGLNMAGGTQFGLDTEQAIAVAKECAGRPGVTCVGLHVYFGSQRLKMDAVQKALDEIEKVMVAFSRAAPLRVIDLGLGLGVPYLGRDPEPELAILGADLQERWQREPWRGREIWFEAGRALVARAGYFVSRITEKKRLHGRTFIFLDGGISVHNPGIGLGRFFSDNPPFCFLFRARGEDRETVEVVGNLCTSADQLGSTVEAPLLEEGDLAVIRNSGAYCATTGMWGFNSQATFSEAVLEEDGTISMLEPQHELLHREFGDVSATTAPVVAREGTK